MRTWHDAVKEAVSVQCAEAYRKANLTNEGKLRRRHVPYRVPELAEEMVKALNNDDEHEGKRLLLIWRTGALSLI